MNAKVFLVIIVIALAMIFSAACTGTDSGNTPATATATPVPTQVTATQTVMPSDMIPGPTQQPDPKYKVDVQVNKNEVYGTVTVIFRGGMGQNFVDNIVVDGYFPNGGHESKNLGTAVGDQVEFPGTQNQQDRIKVTVVYDGVIGTYVIYDSLVPAKLPIPNP